jgi:hypothetical protein
MPPRTAVTGVMQPRSSDPFGLSLPTMSFLMPILLSCHLSHLPFPVEGRYTLSLHRLHL